MTRTPDELFDELSRLRLRHCVVITIDERRIMDVKSTLDNHDTTDLLVHVATGFADRDDREDYIRSLDA